MSSMFSPDSRFLLAIGRICDLVLLNIAFVLCCLPVFTIGAAVSALYTVSFRMMREEDSHPLRQFFRAFRADFRQATIVWLFIAAVVIPSLFYFDRVCQLEGFLRWGALVFACIALVGLLAGSLALPWLSQFRNSTRQTLINGLLLGISHLPRGLCIIAIWLLPVILWAVNYELFLRLSFLWIALYFSAAAYMCAGLLWHVFKPYRQMPPEQ